MWQPRLTTITTTTIHTLRARLLLLQQEMQEHLRSQPALLQEILKSLFEVILFEENSNQWSLSRPMLSLILINEPVYLQVGVGVGCVFWGGGLMEGQLWEKGGWAAR